MIFLVLRHVLVCSAVTRKGLKNFGGKEYHRALEEKYGNLPSQTISTSHTIFSSFATLGKNYIGMLRSVGEIVNPIE